MNNFLKFFLYSIIFILFLIGLGREIKELPQDSDRSFGGRFKYLTSLDMLLQLIFFCLCTINEFLELISVKTELKSVLNFLFRSLAFPIGSFVTLSFWGLYFIDRELVFPEIYDQVIPGWHNHIMHTLPLIGVLIESSWTQHDFARSFTKGVIPTVIAGVCYLIWVFIVAKFGGFWVYPVMDVLSNFQRAIFLSALLSVLAVLYKLGFVVDGFLVVKKKSTSLKIN